MPGLVTAEDAGILYVPHNSVLYVLMRMGLLGGAAFWAMLGSAIIAGCRLAKCPDRLFAAVGTIAAAATVGWALEGGVDLGFTFLRITIVMGCVLGLLEASRHIHAASRSSSTPSLVAASAHSSPGRSIEKNSPPQVVG
jgi:O-antigen ligase